MATAATVKPKPTNKLQSRSLRPARKALHKPIPGRGVLGIVLFLAFFLTGNGLGASGGLNR